MPRTNSDNLFGLSPFIVDANPSQGSYTTVQAAINDCASIGGGKVFVRPGLYFENLLLASNVQLIGVTADGRDQTITINGNVSITAPGVYLNENLTFLAVAGNTVTISNVAGSAIVAFKFCRIQSSLGNAFSLNAAAPGLANLSLFNSGVRALQQCFNQITNCGITLDGCVCTSVGAFALATLSGSGSFECTKSELISIDRGIDITVGAITADVEFSTFNCNQEAVVIAPGSTSNLYHCTVDSMAASGDFVNGGGTVSFVDIVLTGTAVNNSAAITAIRDWKPYADTAPTAATAATRGTATFDNSAFTSTGGFIESRAQMITGDFSIAIDFTGLGSFADFFTVPAGKTFYPMSVVVETIGVVGFVAGPTLSFGTTPLYNELKDAAVFGSSGLVPFFTVFSAESWQAAGGIYPSPFVGGTTIGMRVVLAAVAATMVGRAFITGILK